MSTARAKHRRPVRAAAAVAGGASVQRFLATALTATVLFALYTGYHVLTRSLQVPSGNAQRHLAGPFSVPVIPQFEERTAQKFLPGHPWVAKAATIGRTIDKRTLYYFKEWKQESKKVVTFRPFALISTRKDAKPGDPPYTVVSEAASITTV